MTDYQNNSNKAKGGNDPQQPEKKIERITSSQVIVRKKGPWRTFKSLIIEADMSSVGRFVWLDLLVPTIKNVIVDTAEQGIKRLVYGDLRASYRPTLPSSSMGIGRQGLTTYTPYNQASLPMRAQDPRTMQGLPSRTVAADARGYIISSKEDAEDVLTMLATVIDRYEVVTVADLHEMLGLPSNHVDHRWGWIDVRNAQIRQVREGWILELPRPEEIPN